MPHAALSATVARLRLSALCDTNDATDGQLLSRFVCSRDEAAFAELVRRLGPMVLGVCRRVSGDVHLADDAFQAVFLVLARRATIVRPREAVRGWLYGVAVRCAQKARTMSARRRFRETPVPTLPEQPAEPTARPDADALSALDEEIAALPDHLRVTVVLCELDGVSRKEAADRLGIPEGTVCSRLAKARKRLATRLKRRGVAFSLAALATLGQAFAAVSPRLVRSTTALVNTSASVLPVVAALSNGVFRTMLLQKLKVTAAGALLLAALLAVASSLPGLAANEPRGQPVVLAIGPGELPRDEPKAQPAARPAGPGTLLLARRDGFIPLSPDGKEGTELTPPKDTHTNFQTRLSPDGTRAAFIVTRNEPPRPPVLEGQAPEPWPFKVGIRKLDKPDSEKVWDMPAQWLNLSWTADGKQLVVAKHPGLDRGKNVENLLLDPETGETKPLDLPAGVWVLDCGRDGKTFLVAVADPTGKTKKKLGLAEKGDAKVRELTDLTDWPPGSVTGRLSPDGTKVLFAASDPGRKDAHKWGMSHRPYLLDVKTGKCEPLAEFPDNGRVVGITWSPDGKKMAYTWVQLHDELLKKDTISADDVAIQTEAFLIVADADGKNAKTVASAKGDSAINMIYGSIDWR